MLAVCTVYLTPFLGITSGNLLMRRSIILHLWMQSWHLPENENNEKSITLLILTSLNLKLVWTKQRHTLLKSDCMSTLLKSCGRKDCCLMFWSVQKSRPWLWRWLHHRLPKHQSSTTTVFLRTPCAWTISFRQGTNNFILTQNLCSLSCNR